MKIDTLTLNNLFDDTINRCTYNLVNKSDEIIEYELFEEFDIGATSFLHEDSLNRLMNHKFIDEDIKNLCVKLRKMFFEMPESECNSNSVRHSKKWEEILNLSDTIRKKKKNIAQINNI